VLAKWVSCGKNGLKRMKRERRPNKQWVRVSRYSEKKFVVSSETCFPPDSLRKKCSL
jgi:hypothetical protein